MNFPPSRFVSLKGALLVTLVLSLFPAEGSAGVTRTSRKARVSKIALKAQVRADRRAARFGTRDPRTVQAQGLVDRLTGRSGLVAMPKVTRIAPKGKSGEAFLVGTLALQNVKQFGRDKGLIIGTTTVRFDPKENTAAALQRRMKIHGEDAASLSALGKLGLQTRVVGQSFGGLTYSFKIHAESVLGKQIQSAYPD